MKTGLEKDLERIAVKIDKMIRTHDYVFEDIFSKPFMLEYTNSSTIENFLINSPLGIDFPEDVKNLSDTRLDQYVSNNTPFTTWNDMYIKGVKIFLAKKLGL